MRRLLMAGVVALAFVPGMSKAADGTTDFSGYCADSDITQFMTNRTDAYICTNLLIVEERGVTKLMFTNQKDDVFRNGKLVGNTTLLAFGGVTHGDNPVITINALLLRPKMWLPAEGECDISPTQGMHVGVTCTATVAGRAGPLLAVHVQFGITGVEGTQK